MSTWKRLQRTLAWTAGMTLLVPSVAWTEEGKPAASTAAAPAKSIIPDVALGSDGSFKGTLIDGARKPLRKTPVTLKQDGKLVVTVQTNDKGEYILPSLKPGAYQLTIKEQTIAIRVWKPAAAPAKALQQLDMAYVPDADVVRGQFGYLDPVNTSLLLLGVTGVVLGSVAVAEINNLQDDVKKLQSP